MDPEGLTSCIKARNMVVTTDGSTAVVQQFPSGSQGVEPPDVSPSYSVKSTMNPKGKARGVPGTYVISSGRGTIIS